MTEPKRCPTCGSNDPAVMFPVAGSGPNTYHCDNDAFHDTPPSEWPITSLPIPEPNPANPDGYDGEPTPSEDDIVDHDVCLRCGTRLDVPVIALADSDARVAEAVRAMADNLFTVREACIREAVAEEVRAGQEVREACVRRAVRKERERCYRIACDLPDTWKIAQAIRDRAYTEKETK